MSFVEIKPGKNRSKNSSDDKIRISFPENKKRDGNSMIMYIGKSIAGQVGIRGGDKVKFYIDSTNERVWLVKKSSDDIGYTAMDIESAKGKKSDSLRMQMTWKQFKPSNSEIPIHNVKHDIHDGGIRVYTIE